MFYKLQLAVALAVWQSATASAQACPELEVLVYGADDQTCGGSSSVVVLQNMTVLSVSGGFASVDAGHTNDPAWEQACVVFSLANANTGLLSGAFAAYTGSEDFSPTCTNTTNSQGDIGSALLMYCSLEGGPTDCGPGGGGGTATSTSSSSNVPSTTATYSDVPYPTTTPPNTTPSPTDTSAPNTEIQDAISSASSAISVAQAAAAALAANPTDEALAEAAESDTYTAMAVNQAAINLANDYSASAVASDLEAVDSDLETAALAAVGAAALLTAAAANEFLNAFDDVQNAAQVAAADAADPVKNPRPQKPKPTSSKPTPGPCPCTVYSADVIIPEPTETPADLPAGFPGSVSNSDQRRRSNDVLTLPDLDDDTLPPAILDFLGSSHDEEDTLVDSSNTTRAAMLSKRATNDRGRYCGLSFQTPSYLAYGQGMYSPVYSYYEVNQCGRWDWVLTSAATSAGLFEAPPGYGYPSKLYATEHIYEIQSVARFLDYARTHIPQLQQAYQNASSFCTDFFVPFLATAKTFGPEGSYDYSIAPVQQVYNTLDGGVGGSGASEFVSLVRNVNLIKGFFFGLKGPSVATTLNKALVEITRAAVMVEYLNTPAVASIYRAVSARIKGQFVNFGTACQSATDPAYAALGEIDWAGTYSAWEEDYLNAIETEVQDFVLANVAVANVQIDAMLDDPELAQQTRGQLEMARTAIARQQGRAPGLRGKIEPNDLIFTALRS